MNQANRIRASHAGVLPRPADLQEAGLAGPAGYGEFRRLLPGAVAEIVQRQVKLGLDIVNDGELSKRDGFSGYVRQRLGGIYQRPFRPGEERPRNVNQRDQRDFPGFYAAGLGVRRRPAGRTNPTPVAENPYFCNTPLSYVGEDLLAADVANFTAALEGTDVTGYLPAIAPGSIEHWLWNEYYPDDESFLYAIADAMHDEYAGIVEAGFLLQIDDPDLLDGWQMFPDMTVDEYRQYAELRIRALNHGLRGIPTDRIRLHVCWGSQHGPHKDDIPLSHMIDLVLQVRAGAYSVEAANPGHEHEWKVWQTVDLPRGVDLMPGVVGHASTLIEHPELVAQRLLRYADIVGPERLIAGTDCGLAARVEHPEIAWAKLESLVQGTRLANEQLGLA